MATDFQIDISLPIEDIIKRKIAYHEEQIKFHQEQINIINKDFKTYAYLSASENTPDDKKASQKEVKPLILKYLKEYDIVGGMTTNDVYENFKKDFDIHHEDRTTWIAVISQSFNSLIKSGLVKSEPMIGQKGNYYKLKSTSSDDEVLKNS